MNNDLIEKIKLIFALDDVVHVIHSDIDETIIIKSNSFYYNRLGSESLQQMEELGYRIGFLDFDVNMIVFHQIDYDIKLD